MTPSDADRSSNPVRQCHEALFEEALTNKILGAFYDVYRTLGYGFLESVYSRALELELVSRNLHVARQVATEVLFKGQRVGIYRADIIVESRVVLELKASRKCDGGDSAQLLNHLRATNLELGFLLHFGPRPSFKRLIASNEVSRPKSYPRSSVQAASSVAALSTENALALTPFKP